MTQPRPQKPGIAEISRKSLWRGLWSNGFLMDPHDIHRRPVKFLRMSLQQKHHQCFENGSRPRGPSGNKPSAFPPLALGSAPSVFLGVLLPVALYPSVSEPGNLSRFLLVPAVALCSPSLSHGLSWSLSVSLSLSLCLSGFPHLCDSHVCPAPAFMFRLDASTSHQNLRVDDLSVEWDAMGGKVQDIKAREKDGKGRTASPVNSPAR